MNIEHISGGMIVTTDRDGDRIRFQWTGTGGVTVRMLGKTAYVENEDALEVAEFIKASRKAQIECDKCQGKGKVLR